MSLEAGNRLGPYEITAKLGEGGMGVVYKAKDFHLGRDVAIKVLPDALASDPERLARFEREAKLLAQLNHPNIAHVYGLETGGATRALVMELVEGPTLAERLEQGPLPFHEGLSISLQIAHALEEAHEKGIVHRDLKPQNVKASMAGKVKVLDFGLAKAMDPAGGAIPTASALAHSPTLTLGETVQGVILGTAAYMSPEQAAGAVVDRRADIWSFGVVLYEMLVGRRLFEGETVSHVLAGVLKDEPDFSLLPADVAPRVRRLVYRCLRKKPRERLQSIGDARLVLEEVIAGKDRDEAPPVAAAVPAPPPRSFWIPVAAAGVAMLALGLAGGRWLLAPRAEANASLRLELAIPPGWSVEWGAGQQSLALSPDARRTALAVIGKERRSGLLVRDLGELESRLLEGTEGARAPFFSPDGDWIGYFTERDLMKVAARGGKPIRLAEAKRAARGAVWGRDGWIYFSADRETGIARVRESAGPVEPVTQVDASRRERTHRWPELSPDGRFLLFANDTTESPNFLDDARIEALELATGERHVVIEGASQARLLADDVLVYASAGNLLALAIDPQRLVPRGKPVTLEQAIASNLGTGAIQLGSSRVGSGAWIPGATTRPDASPIWHAADGASSISPIPASQPYHQLELSPDGRRVALAAGGVLGAIDFRGADIWVADLERGTLSRLSFDENASAPTWTPDGLRIAYRRVTIEGESPKGTAVVWRSADGSGEPEVLLDCPDGSVAPSAFSPDGRALVVMRMDVGKGDLLLLPLDPRGPPRPLLATPHEERVAEVSPDGRWIAYLSTETGETEVYVRPFPAGSGKWQISTAGGLEPRWARDGRTLYYRAIAGGELLGVAVEAGTSFRAALPERRATGFRTGPNAKTYGIAPDGKRFLSLPTMTGFGVDTELRAVSYSDDWLARARRLLGLHR